jgi:hypothetical protein
MRLIAVMALETAVGADNKMILQRKNNSREKHWDDDFYHCITSAITGPWSPAVGMRKQPECWTEWAFGASLRWAFYP